MLRSLHLKDVGPAPELKFEFAPRLNLLTGDNGLGKSFVLDVLWYAHTWSWWKNPAMPRKDAKRDTSPRPGNNYLTSEINYRFVDSPKGQGRNYRCSFHASDQEWESHPTDQKGNWMLRDGSAGGAGARRMDESLFPGDGIVIYARVDGGFSVWDSYRNRGRHENSGPLETRLRTYEIDRDQVWDGPKIAGARPFNGLIYDWVRWQQSNNGPWTLLKEVLAALTGEGPAETLKPGDPARVSVDDTRDIPTLVLPYGSVPITLASAGMRRVASLAYIIVWAWYENKLAAELFRAPVAKSIVVLIDEVETHLHPAWQRLLLPALMRVLARLNDDIQVQVFASTHSPMVMASVESSFDEALDEVHHFSMDGSVVSARGLPFVKRGDASGWLTSDSFGMHSARSVEGERAIEAAMAFMRGDTAAAQGFLAGIEPADLPKRTALKERVHETLCLHLGGHDRFWPRWVVTYEKAAGKPKPREK